MPCPSVYIERVGFEMDKHYQETKLQVLISPAVLIARDIFEVSFSLYFYLSNVKQHLIVMSTNDCLTLYIYFYILNLFLCITDS